MNTKAGRKPTSKNFETKVQLDLSEYIKSIYPDIIFTAESSGIKLTMGQSIVAKRCRSSRGLPDMWIMEAKKGYHGCFIELKKDDVIEKYDKENNIRIEKVWYNFGGTLGGNMFPVFLNNGRIHFYVAIGNVPYSV